MYVTRKPSMAQPMLKNVMLAQPIDNARNEHIGNGRHVVNEELTW